ncbi:ABC transporter substrate-binding protein [Martelella alba]|uniref:ABC transporter substrate-binding protein n=1 Tax=Martelella alba TaxID=2590451 RepID=A0ABY2SKA6_9HYPH|nr:ABC transporter substrate-binding protein [Martelella alba]TKI05953.1 ABC transporter substrate-binding protein [Martelella alba]
MTLKTLKRHSALFSLALACLGAAAPSQAAQPALIESGHLTYGTAATFMPFEFMKNNRISGFDIDLITAIGHTLSLTPVAMPMEFKGLIPALQGKRIDIINSAMYINATRAEQVDFVPYLRIGSRVVVRKGNPEHITGRDHSLCGKNIAVTLGGIEESQARVDDKHCRDAGLKGINVMTFPAATDSAVAVAQGRADAEFLSTPGAVALLSEKGDVFETAGGEFESDTQIGFAVRKGDSAMKHLLETGLHQVVQDGTYQQLIEKWRFPASVAMFK